MSLDSHRKDPPPRPPLTGLRWESFLSATDAAGSAFGRGAFGRNCARAPSDSLQIAAIKSIKPLCKYPADCGEDG